MKTRIKQQTLAALTTSVNLKPTEDQLIIETRDLYYAIDTLITTDGYTNNNIMKRRGESTLFWDWTVVSVGKHRIPAPIHTSSPGMSTLYRWNNEPVLLPDEECAYVTAYFYLEMLYRFAFDWQRISEELPFIVPLLEDGVAWVQRVPDKMFQRIMFALKSRLSEQGHMVLN